MNIPDCDICGKQQTELGGIEFGPPVSFEGYYGVYCRKLHVCVNCSRARSKAHFEPLVVATQKVCNCKACEAARLYIVACPKCGVRDCVPQAIKDYHKQHGPTDIHFRCWQCEASLRTTNGNRVAVVVGL